MNRLRVLVLLGPLVVWNADAQAPVDDFASSLREWQAGFPESALAIATRPSDSIAMALLRAELVASIEGPAGLASLHDSSGSPEERLATEAIERRIAQQVSASDAALLTLCASSRSTLDSIYLSLQLLRNARLPTSPFSVTQADSLERSVRSALGRDSPEDLEEFLGLAARSASAVVLASRADRAAGIARLTQILEEIGRTQHRLLEAEAAFRLGFLSSYGYDSTTSLEAWSRAIATSERIGDRLGLANALTFRASELSRAGRPNVAIEEERRAHRLHVELGDTIGLAWNRLSFGWNSWLVGNVGDAEVALLESTELFAPMGNARGEGLGWNNLGLIYTETGRSQEAVEAYEQALKLLDESANPQLRSHLYNNMAGLCIRQLRNEEAHRLYSESLRIAREVGDVRSVVGRLGNLGLLSFRTGHVEQARLFFEEAITLARENDEAVGEAYAAHNFASALIGIARLEEAAPLLRRAAAIAEESPDLVLRIAVQLELARLQLYSEAPEGAVAAADECLALAERIGSTPKRLPAWTIKATALSRLGRFDEAVEVARSIERAGRELEDLSFLTVAANLECSARLGAGQLDEARGLSRLAMTRFRRAQEKLGARRWTEDELDTENLYQTGSVALSNFVQTHDLVGPSPGSEERREAFDFLQLLKSRSLLDRLRGASEALRPDVDAAMLQEERRKKLRLDRLRARLASSPSDTLRLEAAEAEAAFHSIRNRVLAADERFARASERAPSDWQTIRGELRAEEALLDFFQGSNAGSPLLFVVTRDGIALRELPPFEEFEPQIDLFLELVRTRPSSPTANAAVELVADDLATKLLPLEAEEFASLGRLTLVPDGLLHDLPFAALRVDGSYLVERFDLTVAPSSSIWTDRRAAARTALAVDGADLSIWLNASTPADPQASEAGVAATELPHAQEEARTLASLFRSTRISTPESVGERAWAGGKVLHFIAHGYFDQRRPWASGIYMGSRTVGGGWLDAADVYHADFRSELVTLSACETARGVGVGGLGLSGFAHSLFGSGARSVVATLWRIDDASTPLLMRRFYERLRDGSDKAAALAAAQRSFIHDPRLGHPFYWGAIVLLGDGDAGIELLGARPWTAATWFGAALVLLLSALLLRRRVRGPLVP